MTVHMWLGIMLMGVSLLVASVSFPLLQGRIKMNYVYGVRFSRAFESEELWMKINRYGAKCLIIWSAVIFITGVLCIIIPFSSRGVTPIVLAFIPATYLIPCIQAYLYSRKA